MVATPYQSVGSLKIIIMIVKEPTNRGHPIWVACSVLYVGVCRVYHTQKPQQ